MKKAIMLISIGISMIGIATAQNETSKAKAGTQWLRHVVLFKFKDDAKPADIKLVEDGFRALATKINLIKKFEWGINNSPENLNQGLTHCFLVSFSSTKDRDDYLVHPDHKAFVELLKPFLDKATVVDYWVQE
ncbi:MAG: Dabb family protein [Bacteroidetes bacterium]|jgi:hypothetical protein|nr:Dabb family protein [Bacteroidota bacterium]